uniref:UDP-N-acetylglucosamine--peptide N-acetylglucosaminyltransferase SPINDLY n=1 Tax=Leptocylindrus danicus TaxID=163516 RepID=A0A7S2KRV1_9STRA|mmetsp:Transcript_25960/g.38743  ORF Transcript_25960/g.38743 Transcript_25960/m.38743 type:complete len:753 (+) Transcript_25960:81-2339(+)|eukprot:CAMPEP_0116035922 /NCGR_PEP_ID=MMETSP0321-20121206/20740_1 /TAXON_ID=163516 /ORGANISM="Leptocylindrus danicus var. danicus, Strain B650" /LENGTH=752 /DNA_ID=CAMNT_0003513015 /DNA_START=44 /DNA_END=2302 /DNA_ORIENTATION=+
MFEGIGEQSQDVIDEEDYDFNIKVETGDGFGRPGTGYRPLTSHYGRVHTGMASRGMTARSGTAALVEGRPMTAVSGAGYQSAKGARFDPLNIGSRPIAPNLVEKAENSPEKIAKQLDIDVHELIEQSAKNMCDGDAEVGLEKAKEAGKKERQLLKFRQNNSMSAQQNHELTYATWFNLAVAYENNDQLEEALHAYSFLLKKKEHDAGRIRVNMGNILCRQEKYTEAIKNYRMALDLLPSSGKETGYKICRNIGNAFIKVGDFRKAIESFEAVTSNWADFQTSFNLVLCFCTIGDIENTRASFVDMLKIPVYGNMEASDGGDEHSFDGEAKSAGRNAHSGQEESSLREEMNKRLIEAEQYITIAARVIAPVIDKSDCSIGYKWVCEQLKTRSFDRIANFMSIEHAGYLLRNKEFEAAIDILKRFERKDDGSKSMAATNLSLIYFLEGDYKAADEYADLAVRTNRYNSKALVNKGNCLFMTNECDDAKDMYLEAIGVQADCAEAIYNLGLTNVRLGLPEEALRAFEKLHVLLPNNPSVIYQIANLYEQQGMLDEATKWFNILTARVPTDPGILSRISELFCNNNKDSQGFHYQLESYRQYPVNINVVTWLGVWFAKNEMYEKSLHFFERATDIQPDEIKWKLAVANCHRRMGNTSKALSLFESISQSNPDDRDCLRYLISICKEVGQPFETYSEKLSSLQRTFHAESDAVLTEESKHDRLRNPDDGFYVKRPLSSGSDRSSIDFADADVNELLA